MAKTIRQQKKLHKSLDSLGTLERQAEALYEAGRLFYSDKPEEEKMSAKVEILNKLFNPSPPFGREAPNTMAKMCFESGLVTLSAPRHALWRKRLGEFPNQGEISVVDVTRYEDVLEHIAARGAALVIEMLRDIRKRRGPDEPAHLGLGIGNSTRRLARHLAVLYEFADGMPRLVLHALTPAGEVLAPLENPITFFNFFASSHLKVEFEGLFAVPVVESAEYDALINNSSHPILRRSFERKKEIDIVVTSLADWGHECGSLGQYVSRWNGNGTGKKAPSAGKNWIGDVQLRPFTKSGPATQRRGPKAVTLFDLPELVELASRAPAKAVVLLVGPCGKCGELKSRALEPLLRENSLHVWSHLVTDQHTASEVHLRL